MVDLSGKQLGSYKLIKLIGKGGFGMVYLAEHVKLQRKQAVKVLHDHHITDPKDRERFLREARTLASLEHYNIVHVETLEVEGTLFYLVMQFLSGGTFQDVLVKHGKPLSLEQAGQYLEQICAALEYAHNQEIAHLDLKPQNLLVHSDGHLMLSDFGLSHLVKGTVAQGGESLQFGTPLYMAPEHFNAKPEKRSDLFALAVMLYFMLTGHFPFEASSPGGIMTKVLREPPTPIRTFRRELPTSLEGVMSRGLAKQPAQRFQSAREMLDAFRATYTAPLVPVPAPPAPAPAPAPAPPLTPAALQVKLTVRQPDGKTWDVTLDKDVSMIGRNFTCEVALQTDPSTSRAHASITRTSSGFLLKDEGSTGGTFLDGQKISQPMPLRDGQ
jgi:serine/threonine protein kinase